MAVFVCVCVYLWVGGTGGWVPSNADDESAKGSSVYLWFQLHSSLRCPLLTPLYPTAWQLELAKMREEQIKWFTRSRISRSDKYTSAWAPARHSSTFNLTSLYFPLESGRAVVDDIYTIWSSTWTNYTSPKPQNALITTTYISNIYCISFFFRLYPLYDYVPILSTCLCDKFLQEWYICVLICIESLYHSFNRWCITIYAIF